MANCGQCLIEDVEIVKLDAQGKCPRCGTDYGPTLAAHNVTIHKIKSEAIESAVRVRASD